MTRHTKLLTLTATLLVALAGCKDDDGPVVKEAAILGIQNAYSTDAQVISLESPKKQTVNIYGQSNRIRITQNKVFELHRRIMLDRDAGVFLRRPRTNVDYLGSVRRRPGNKRKQKSAAGSFQKRPASVHYFLSTSKTWLPRAESAEISQTRPSPSLLSVMVRSG